MTQKGYPRGVQFLANYTYYTRIREEKESVMGYEVHRPEVLWNSALVVTVQCAK